VPELLRPSTARIETRDGLVLESRTSLPGGARCVGEWLVHWTAATPDRSFLVERDAQGAWRHFSYAATARAVEGIASALLELGAVPSRPVVVLSDNGIDAALLGLACMHVGVPFAPLSPAYSLQSTSFSRLRTLADVLGPGLVFADDAHRHAAAIEALSHHRVGVLSSHGSAGSHSLAALTTATRSPAAARAHAGVGPDTIAKVLFTSGSTGTPKGVVNTQRMLTSNQDSLAACWPFLGTTPPIVVDWLPWSHTFGGNHNFFLVLRNGGTLYIDRGRPVPGLIETTLANLADVSPTIWFNVPRGFDQAVPLLERDPELARRVFARLDVVFYAAAALNPTTRARLERVAAQIGRSPFFTSAWGSTETAPLSTSAHFATSVAGVLGVPVPGVRVKLARVGADLELRVAGPNVTPGYWQRGGTIEPAPRDDDGFLATGDAARLVDDDDPDKGIAFVGRISENFKLSSGTWVNVAAVRLGLVEACTPWLLDAVICGHDRESLGALLFPTPAARERDATELREDLRTGLARHNATHPGTSTRVERALVMTSALSFDDGETTDKGYTNQRAVLVRRADDVERLFADGDDVLIVR
jgi:feruloyl-CoA synthase